MPYRKVPFVNGGYYHIFNRGINRQETFLSPRDYKHFLETVFYYSIKNPKPKFSQYSETQLFPINRQKKIVDVLCYCLMPNHFHLLVRQVEEGGVSELMRKSIHSYTKYRNTRLNILGGVFQPISLSPSTISAPVILNRKSKLTDSLGRPSSNHVNFLWPEAS